MKHYARLFVAVPLPDFLVSELATYLPPYEKPGVRPIPEENWHLTAHFIGNVPKPEVAKIADKLKELAPEMAGFELKLLRVAPGPNTKSPRLIWAEFAESTGYEKLVRAITLGLGAKMDYQHPVAHITLARFAKDIRPPKMRATPAKKSTSFSVTEFALWESELRRPHPRYTILERYALGAKNLETQNP